MATRLREDKAMGIQAIAPDLIEERVDGVWLIGGRRKSDGRIVFPLPSGVARAQYEPERLSREGTLWSFTVQRFRPKTPPYAGADDDKTFKPFALGYVELPGQVIVETRIEADDVSQLRIGMKMGLSTAAFPHRGGEPVVTYVFRPIEQAQ
jgi:uncharacterized OB-fold protein